MKRFLRYFLYREGYRLVRKALRESGSDEPVEPDKAREEGRYPGAGAGDLPDGGEPIEEPAQLKAALQRMDAYDFEHFVADLWTRMGWETEVSAEAADKGVDVVATKHTPYEQTTLIQAKRYGPNTTVGSPEVQQYASLKDQYSGVDKVAIVTTNEFTGQAEDLADRLNVKPVDGDDLVQLVSQAEALDLVAEYLEFVAVVEQDDHEQTPREEGDGVSTAEAEPATTADGRSERSAESTDERSPRVVPETVWHKAVAAATIGWAVVLLGVELLPLGAWGMLFFGSWLLLPVALYKDAAAIPEAVEWPQYIWAYLVAALVWFLAIVPGVVYLWKRRKLPRRVESEPSAPESSNSGARPEPGDSADRRLRTIGYGDGRYTCEVALSPDGTWTVAYGQGNEPDDYRLFVYDGDGLRFSDPLSEPVDAVVSESGRTLVVEGLDPDERVGKVTVYSSTGEQLLTHYVNAEVADVAITPDGAVVAVSTYVPDDAVYLFDVDAGADAELRMSHDVRELGDHKPRQLTFKRGDGEWRLAIEADDGPRYVVDLDGTVVREVSPGDPTREAREEHGGPTASSEKESALRDRLDQLQAQYDAADSEPERNDLLERIADTHWELARTIGEDDPDAMMEQLERAKKRYFDLLPWYAGKVGAAKVLRRQGIHHVRQGDEPQAATCFHRIMQLETEYDVELVTEADERRIAELPDPE